MEENSYNHFQTTLVSLSLIILSFFVYLNTLTVPHPVKERKAIASVTSELSLRRQIDKVINEYKFIKATNELKNFTEKYQANLNISSDYISLAIPTAAIFSDDNLTSDGENIFDRLADITLNNNLSIKVNLQYITQKDSYLESLDRAFNLTAKLNRRLIFHGLKEDKVNCLASLSSWKPFVKIEIN